MIEVHFQLSAGHMVLVPFEFMGILRKNGGMFEQNDADKQSSFDKARYVCAARAIVSTDVQVYD